VPGVSPVVASMSPDRFTHITCVKKSAHEKARKRRVPGGHRTPVASGGDWLKCRAKDRGSHT